MEVLYRVSNSCLIQQKQLRNEYQQCIVRPVCLLTWIVYPFICHLNEWLYLMLQQGKNKFTRNKTRNNLAGLRRSRSRSNRGRMTTIDSGESADRVKRVQPLLTRSQRSDMEHRRCMCQRQMHHRIQLVPVNKVWWPGGGDRRSACGRWQISRRAFDDFKNSAEGPNSRGRWGWRCHPPLVHCVDAGALFFSRLRLERIRAAMAPIRR